jgi:hypothetical protein
MVISVIRACLQHTLYHLMASKRGIWGWLEELFVGYALGAEDFFFYRAACLVSWMR